MIFCLWRWAQKCVHLYLFDVRVIQKSDGYTIFYDIEVVLESVVYGSKKAVIWDFKVLANTGIFQWLKYA